MKRYAPYSISDGGRQAAGFTTERNDCLVRAIAIAGQISYQDAHDLARWHGRRNKGATHQSTLLIDALFPHCRLDALAGLARCQWTLGQFIKQNLTGRFICFKRGHAFAVIDSIVYDTGVMGTKTKLLTIWKVG
jgi:hypothetical protein